MSKVKHPEFPVLECRNVFKEYQDGSSIVKVLNGVTLKVEQGEQIAIMGRSGSGKTTLLQVLGGLDSPTTGEVWINNRHLHKSSERHLEMIRNQSIGFIYQMHHLLPEFTALENVAMPLLIAEVEVDEAEERAKHWLFQVGLQARLHHRPSELSGGERQRVAIARALVNDPECVLADEPTGNLDDENALQIFDMMLQLNRAKKTSLIIVTHDHQLAEKMDKIYNLHNGQLSVNQKGSDLESEI